MKRSVFCASSSPSPILARTHRKLTNWDRELLPEERVAWSCHLCGICDVDVGRSGCSSSGHSSVSQCCSAQVRASGVGDFGAASSDGLYTLTRCACLANKWHHKQHENQIVHYQQAGEKWMIAMDSSSQNALQGCVASLRSSMQLLDSSINILDSGVSDYPRLAKVLQTQRVRTTQTPHCTSGAADMMTPALRARLRTRPHHGPSLPPLRNPARSLRPAVARRVPSRQTGATRAIPHCQGRSTGGPAVTAHQHGRQQKLLGRETR